MSRRSFHLGGRLAGFIVVFEQRRPVLVTPGLRLGVGDGLAGPPLDFGSTVASSDDSVVTLAATDVSPGVRPASDAPALYWFESTRP